MVGFVVRFYKETLDYTFSDFLTKEVQVSKFYLFALLQDYLEAGADFVETNTFNGTAISQSDYGTEQLVC